LIALRAGLDTIKKRKSLAKPGIKIQYLHCPTYTLVTVLTELSWLVTNELYLSSKIINILEYSAALFTVERWKNSSQKIDVEEGTDIYEFVVNENCVNRTGLCGWMGQGHDNS
jgi:hypothetical protein